MGSNQDPPDGRSQKEKKPEKTSSSSPVRSSWFKEHAGTITVLIAIICIAIFLRVYFGYPTTVDNNFATGGGSDPFYNLRMIQYVQTNHGTGLIFDNMLNYPFGVRTERAPMYNWAIAVTAMMLNQLTGISLTTTTGYTFLAFSTVWGVLTIIPVYLIGKNMFGNRAGILAALVLAIMPANISESFFGEGDYHAFCLFLATLAVYFFIKALKAEKGTKWVSSWTSGKSIISGLRSYFSQNRLPMIYSALVGVILAALAYAWTGYDYIIVIILLFLLVQVLICLFRKQDPMGPFMIVTVMMLVAFALIAPAYWQLQYWQGWFTTPFYLFVVTTIVAGYFVVMRDRPWVLSIPLMVVILGVGALALSFIIPGAFNSIISGQGYFIKTAIYATVGEAQAPTMSYLAMSFGALMFWISIIGIIFTAYMIRNSKSPALVFLVVWSAIVLILTAYAERFIVLATPSMAIMAGVVIAWFISIIHFEDMTKPFAGFWHAPWSTFRKAIKFKYVVAILVIAFLLILPNVWSSIDADIPSNTETAYDAEIYYTLPSILHPSSYDVVNGTSWYMGAFSYDLDLPTNYWPAAFSWFAQQDANLSDNARPAFLSWWDYGFQEVEQGQHPTVADDFQNAYQFAAAALMATNETQLISLFIIRTLDYTGTSNSSITNILRENGVDVTTLYDIINNSSNYISVILANPSIYGNYTSSLTSTIAQYAAGMYVLSKLGTEGVVNLYQDCIQATGVNIGYFAVDSELFPFSAYDTGTFYAPASLDNRAIDPTSNAPTDYYQIYALVQDTNGNYNVVTLNNITSTDTVIYYYIEYTNLFYQTMIYRTLFGISPADINSTSQGVPGLSGSLENYDPEPAYNLSHFMEVYRTAYYNPYNDTTGHSSSWVAISYDTALVYQQLINEGKMSGTVDLSADALESGVVFLQYYDGVIVSGNLTHSDGTAYPNAYVTVVDQYGIPHQLVETNSTGYYSVIVPFNTSKVIFSNGTLNATTLTGSNILYTSKYDFTYAEAMRQPGTTWEHVVNVALTNSTISGKVTYDTVSGTPVSNATVTLENSTIDYQEVATTNSTGNYNIQSRPGVYELSVSEGGKNIYNSTVTLIANGTLDKDVSITPSYSINLGSGTQVQNTTSYIVPVTVKNTGNIADQYNVTITNVQYLTNAGWNATIQGTNVTYKEVSVQAQSSSIVYVLLTKTSSSASPSVSANISAQSDVNNTSNAKTSIALQKLSVAVTGNGISISGDGASTTAPSIPLVTWLYIAGIMVMLLALVSLTVNRGVFGRRKKR